MQFVNIVIWIDHLLDDNKKSALYHFQGCLPADAVISYIHDQLLNLTESGYLAWLFGV